MIYYTMKYYSPTLGGRVVRYSAASPEGEQAVTIPVPRGRGAREAKERALDDLRALVGEAA